jgi:hypothetical protein
VSDDLVRLRSSFGSDEINVGTRRYFRRDDQAFYLLPEDAAQVLADGKSGFHRVDDWASPTPPPLGLVVSLIRGMKPSLEKTALLAALTSLKLRVTSPHGTTVI